MFKLWPFPGGVFLDSHKDETSGVPLELASLPRELVYPLLARNGQAAKPVVKPGDRVLKGQIIAGSDDYDQPPVHAATSGRIRGVEPRSLFHPSGSSADCIIIEADGLDESIELHGIDDFSEREPQTLRQLIHAAGIVGLGGAGFPTAIKLDPGGGRPIDALVLNGVECEPYISCDDALMRYFPEEVLGGAEVLMHILGAKRCWIGVEDDMPGAISSMDKANNNGGREGIEIVPIPSIYPSGSEKQLIKALTGREVPAEGTPADMGVVCQNVATAAAVHKAVRTGEPLISRIVTVAGKGVAKPRNLLARIGTPVAELVAQCGGYTDQAQRLIMGGPMMGLALASDDLPIGKTTNCILVPGPGEVATDRESAQQCIRCGACAAACPASLLPQQLYWHSRAGQWQKAADYRLVDCIECGCCDYVCPSQIPLAQYFRLAKGKVAAHKQELDRANRARTRFEAKQARIQREKLERAGSIRRKKELLGRSQGTATRE